MISENALWIWIYLPLAAEPKLAGRLTIEDGGVGKKGVFVYGKSYLANPQAIPVDPVSLPLENKPFLFSTLGGYPGVVVDSCPDRWGIRIIDRLYGRGTFPISYLLRNDPGRSGALAFSSSQEVQPTELESRHFTLSALLAAAKSLENGQDVDHELLKALSPGTGGARPKCNIEDNGEIFIAKFPSLSDPEGISIPRLEHASMLLAKECGLNVADTRLVKVDDQDVLLVKRFDRSVAGENVYRKAFLSARSVFYADPAFHLSGQGSYYRLARWLPKYGEAFSQKLELFKRMVFNVAIRNSDDHELNHGLIREVDGTYQLSPAYDVLPVLNASLIQSHSLLIGDDAYGTISNILNNVEAFDLSREQALFIIGDIQNKIRHHYQECLWQAGLDDREISQVEHVFSPIPIDRKSSFTP